MTGSPTPRVFLASILAGPLVVTFGGIAWWASEIPHPIAINPMLVLSMALFLPLSAGVGFPVALVCNTIGSHLLVAIGAKFPLLRFPFLWPVVGGLAAWGILRTLGAPDEFLFPFSAAGAACALICRMRLNNSPD